MWIILFCIIILIVLLIKYKAGSAENLWCPHYKRTLGDKSLPYEAIPIEYRLTIKLGQFKLLLTELEFYVDHGGEEEVVVYAGSAAGFHQKAILPFFKKWQFIFYDPRKFDPEIQKFKNVEIHQEFFTEKVAKSLAKRFGPNKILFLSDIRTDDSEDAVDADMIAQKTWCDILKPRMAMLKFRLPWVSDFPVNYYDGQIYLQPYIGPTSSESRLVTNCKKEIVWDNDDYNNKMRYFNQYQRIAYYDFKTPDVPGIDHCYDCWAMTGIIKKFMASSFARNSDASIEDLIQTFMGASRQTLDIPPHGQYPEERDVATRIDRLKEFTLKYQMYLQKRKEKSDIHDASK